VLPAPNRLRRSRDFQRVVRQGRRITASTVVTHALPGESGGVAQVGFVVSRAAGPATRRNLIKRRLRHAVRPHLEGLDGHLLVLRARPEAATADYARLQADVDRCLCGFEEEAP
jgi:ribonuclease P protein component